MSIIGRTDRGERVQLTDTQQRALTDLAIAGRLEFTRREYEVAGGVGKSSAAEDLGHLVRTGVLTPLGQGTARRYRFASAPRRQGWHGAEIGRPRTWTDDRIEVDLRALVGESRVFPSIKEFDDAGRRDLYNAIQRHGGSRRWAERLGIEPPRRGKPPRDGK